MCPLQAGNGRDVPGLDPGAAGETREPGSLGPGSGMQAQVMLAGGESETCRTEGPERGPGRGWRTSQLGEAGRVPRAGPVSSGHPTPGPSSPGPVPAGSASWVLQFTVRPKPGDGAGAAGGTAVQGPSGPAPPAVCQGKSCRSLGTWGWPSPVVPFVPPEGLWAGEEVPWRWCQKPSPDGQTLASLSRGGRAVRWP